MSKNKLVWSIALGLIAALPIAYAQAAAGFNWAVLAINTIVVFIVLFLLQAVLIPRKPEKERNAVWVIVLLASLLLAYLFGKAGYLWEHPALARFVSIYVLVNAIVIAAVLYFLLGFVLKDKVPKSPEGIGGYGILIFLVAMVFAVKIGNQWVWDQGTIKELARFFFGNEGILTTNKNRIFVFIGSAVLLSWFFNFVAIGKENTKINYALAIIFAAHMASGPDPYTIDNLKTLLLIVGTWVLGNNLSEKFTGRWKIAGYVIAFALIYWATSIVETAATPEGRAVAAERGWLSAIFSTLWGNKGLLILGIIILIIFFVILRGENNALVKDIRERYGRIIWNKIKDSAAKGLLNWITFWIKWPKRETPKDMMPLIMLENLYIFHALTNYMKRLFIFFSKWGQVRDAANATSIAYTQMGKHLNEVMLIEELKAFRNGGVVQKRDSEGNLIGGEERIEGGWFGTNKEMMELVNDIVDYTQKYIKLTIEHGITAPKDKQIKGDDPYWKLLADDARGLADRLGTILGKIQNYSKNTKERLKAYGPHNVVRAWRYLILDQCNPSGGRWPHTYLFVLPGTELINFKGELTGKTTEFTEVTMFGEVLEDIYKTIDRYGEQQKGSEKIRKVKDTRKIIFHPNPHQMYGFIDNEWEGFVRDIRFGAYHPYSRSVHDYVSKMIYKRIFYDDNQITVSLPSKKDAGNPAFDREALKNPGSVFYWGRTRYYDKHTDVEPKNPYPALSNFGMSRYLHELTVKDMKDKREAIIFLNRFLGDTGEWVTDTTKAKEAIGLLGETKGGSK